MLPSKLRKHSIRAAPPGELHGFLTDVKRSIEQIDSFGLKDALVDIAILVEDGGSIAPGPAITRPQPQTPVYTTPPTPTSVSATPSFSVIFIEFDPAIYVGHGYAEIFRSSTSSFGNAVAIGQTPQGPYIDGVGAGSPEYWYWVRFVNGAGDPGAINSQIGVSARTSVDPEYVAGLLTDQINGSHLAQSLAAPIGQIPSISITASAALAQANANLAAISTMQSEIADLSGTPDYNAATTYAVDDIVRYNGGLYRATATTTGNLPTNTAFWVLIGNYASLGDAVAGHAAILSDHETRITNNNGEITSQANQITTLQAGLTAANGQISQRATTSAVQALDTRVTQVEGVNTAQSNAITNLQSATNSLNDGLAAAASATNALGTRVTSAENVNTAQANALTALNAAITDPTTGLATKASLTQLAQTEANANSAVSTAQQQLTATIRGLGGENLYLGPDPLIATPGTYGTTFVLKLGSDNPHKMIPGEPMTISADVSQDAASLADGVGRVARIIMWSENAAGTWIAAANAGSATETPTRVSATFYLPPSEADMHAVGFGVWHIGGNETWLGTVRAERILVERGTVATAYKIGQRNLSAQIATFQQAQANQQQSIASLTTAVQAAQQTADGRATVGSVNAVNARVDTTNNGLALQGQSIQALQTSLAGKADTSYVDQVELRVDATENALTTQGQTIQGLQSALPGKADASALTQTNTNVANLAGSVSAQSEQITTLQSSLQLGRNLADVDWWTPGAPGATLPPPWYYNGEPAESQFVNGIDHSGVPSVLLRAVSDSDPFAAGGFDGGTFASPIDRTKTYRFVIPVRKDNAVNARLYWGTANVCDVNTSTVNGNPYFAARHLTDQYQLGDWFLMVGYVFPQGSTGRTHDGAGIFHVKTGALVPDSNGTNYCWNSTSTPYIRAFQFYPVSAGSIAHFGKPMVHIVDGSEPPLESLLAGQRNLTASLQVEATTRADQTGELYAQYTVKLDVGGKVSGFGLASTGPTSAGSAFAIRADRFYIAPPVSGAGDATSDIIPFVVQATATTDAAGVAIPAGVYMDTAFMRRLVATRGQIGLLAVDDARIASVSVGKLIAGSISVGEYIQSTGYVPGAAGFRINGDGTAELSQVVVRGTVFAAQGSIGGWTIGPNYLQSTNYELGVGGVRLGSDGNGQIGALSIGENIVYSTGYIEGFSGIYMTGAGRFLAVSNGGQNLIDTGAVGAQRLIYAGDGFDLRANGDLYTSGRVQSPDGRTFFDPKASGSNPVLRVLNSSFSEMVRIEANGRAVFNDIVYSRPNIVAQGWWFNPSSAWQFNYSPEAESWAGSMDVLIDSGYDVLEDVFFLNGPGFFCRARVTAGVFGGSVPGGQKVADIHVETSVAFEQPHFPTGTGGVPGGRVLIRLRSSGPRNHYPTMSPFRITQIQWALLRMT